MLSKRQFASAAGATEKWIDNACRLLGRRVDRTEREARWFGLVHAIAVAFDMSLVRAANLATRALELDPCSRSATIAAQGDDSMWVVIDLECYHSRFGIALAAALLDQPFHRGPAVRHLTSAARTRPAILCRATALGINTSLLRGLALATPARRLAVLGHDVLTLLQDLSNARIRYILTGDVAAVIRGVPRAKARLEVLCAPDPIMPTLLAQLLVDWAARPLGASTEYPFVPDERTIRDAPVLAVTTRRIPIVLRRASVQEFASMADSSDLLDLGGLEAVVPRVPALIATLRATRQPVPATAIPELEAAAVVLNRVHLKP